MKTSDKILISIITVIFTATILLFVTAKKHEIIKKESRMIFYQIQPFSVIVVEKDGICKLISVQNVTITKTNEKGQVTDVSNEMNELRVYTNTSSAQAIDKVFEQRSDTLFIYAGAKVSVLSSGNLKSVIGHQHKLLFLEGVKTGDIQLAGGKTNIAALTSHNRTLNVNISNNALVNCDFNKIDSLIIKSDNSEINFPFRSQSPPTKFLSAKLKRNSELNSLDQYETVSIQKDNSSYMNISSSVVYSNILNDFDKIEP